MTPQLSDSVLKVAGLVERPGTSRPLALALPPPEGLVLSLAELAGPIRLDGVVESVVDGLLVRGRLSARLAMACARCLKDVSDEVAVDVVELFVDPVTSEDEVEPGYEIHDGQLDLSTLVRDALAVAVPYQPLCGPDCQGLCPQCGADRNEAACDCRDEHSDSRWAVLQTLRLPEG